MVAQRGWVKEDEVVKTVANYVRLIKSIKNACCARSGR